MQKLQPKKGALGLYIILLVAAVAAMLAVKQCSTRSIGERPDNTAGGDTLNVAMEISPTSLSLEADTLSGEYYNMLRQVLAKHGIPLRLHPYTRIEDALQWLRNGRVRLVVGDLPVTTEMRREFIFVNPVALDKQVLVQLREADTVPPAVQNQFDLAQKEVTVPKGSPYIARLRNLSHEIGDTIYIREDPVNSSEQLVILTALGKIPMAVVSGATARKLSPRYPLLDTSVDISLNQFQSWALAPRDSLLCDSLTRWLR